MAKTTKTTKEVKNETIAKVETVTKTNLIELVAELADQPKTVTSDIVNATIDTIMEQVASGKQVQIKGFVTFGSRVKAAGTGRNPQTGEEIEIAEQPVTTAKVGREFKRIVKEAYVPSKSSK